MDKLTAVDQVFDAIRAKYLDHVEARAVAAGRANLSCIRENKLSHEQCFALGESLKKPAKGWSHDERIVDFGGVNTMSAQSSYTIVIESGEKKMSLEGSASIGIGSYTFQVNGNEPIFVNVSSDGRLHCKNKDKAEHIAFQGFVKTALGIDLPVTVDDAPFAYYILGMQIYSFTEPLDLPPVK